MCDQICPNNIHLLFSYTKYITGKKVLGTLSPKFAQVAVKKYETKITKYFLFNLKFYLMKQDYSVSLSPRRSSIFSYFMTSIIEYLFPTATTWQEKCTKRQSTFSYSNRLHQRKMNSISLLPNSSDIQVNSDCYLR